MDRILEAERLRPRSRQWLPLQIAYAENSSRPTGRNSPGQARQIGAGYASLPGRVATRQATQTGDVPTQPNQAPKKVEQPQCAEVIVLNSTQSGYGFGLAIPVLLTGRRQLLRHDWQDDRTDGSHDHRRTNPESPHTTAPQQKQRRRKQERQTKLIAEIIAAQIAETDRGPGRDGVFHFIVGQESNQKMQRKQDSGNRRQLQYSELPMDKWQKKNRRTAP